MLPPYGEAKADRVNTPQKDIILLMQPRGALSVRKQNPFSMMKVFILNNLY